MIYSLTVAVDNGQSEEKEGESQTKPHVDCLSNNFLSLVCEKIQDGAPLSELMSFISNYFTIFSSYQLTAKRCRIVEQLTDSAVYISPYFLDYWSYSQSPQLSRCIDNPASYVKSLFPTGQC